MGKFKFIHSRNVPRPQVRFQDQADNSNSPFVPRLKEKPNACVPLPDGESIMDPRKWSGDRLMLQNIDMEVAWERKQVSFIERCPL